MAVIGLSLFVVLLNMHLSHAALSRYGTNVQTTYEAYYVREGTSTLQYYYVRVCTRTCGAHLVFCWKKKWVCRDQRRSRWVTAYKSVRKYRPRYRCKSGWKQSGSSCTIPECYGCYYGGYCNRPWTCVCRSGWTGSRCRSDINECRSSWRNRCSYKSGCINTYGGYRCTCPTGYYLSGRTCYDINECSRNTHSCSYKEGCQNTRGSYRCTCETGYYLDDDQRTCKDVDECSTYENGCSYKGGCQNTNGSYTCTCLAGYYLDADMRTCKDVNECEDSDCQQACINYPGGYNCSCYNGYRTNSTDYKHCDEIDECSEKLAGCSQICTNTPGSFNCSCDSGYYLGWDKRFCSDIDECNSSRHGCQHMCVNTLGSYKCRCRPGFESFRDGKNCTGKPCLPIYRPVNGNKTCSGYTTEHTCAFSCSVGYKQVGSHNRTCSASKRWTGKEAKCEPIHCPAPPEPANGFVYSPCNTRFNSECLVGCDNGYYINETAKLKCTVNGAWEPRKITCNEIKVCEPNPCRHGGECTTITSRQFSCDCSNTGYQGTTCEIGVIDIPDYPTLAAGVPTKSLEFRASPPDNYVIFTPRGLGVEFDPPYLVFQRNFTTSQPLTMTAQQPGLYYVHYYLSGPSAAGFEIPEPNAFFVESAENATPNISAYDNGELAFPSGCYKLQLNECPRSNVTITAYSTSPWIMFGPTATTDGQVSLSTGNEELPHSTTGINFSPAKNHRSSLNHDCTVDSSVTYSTAELIKRRMLTKSFLNVVRRSLPSWLDIKLRGNLSLSSMVETDLQAYYLSGKSLREEAAIKGQPLSEDTFFSLLLSPDLDLFVHGDRVSFGLQDRSARFSVALELCGQPPSNVILRPSPGTIDAMNKLSVMKQLRDRGWKFEIDSVQISRGLFGKRSLTMFATFSKDLDISNAVKSRVNFGGTIIVNVDNLNNIMDAPLDQNWLVELYGNVILTLEFKVQSKMTKLAIKMPRTQSYATFGGSSPEDCLRETNNNPHGLRLSSVLEENPFVRTKLNEFVELDQTRNMSCFLSTILYTDKRSNGSNYRETSDGIIMTFRGHLKFGSLRFDNLDVKLWMENLRCPNTAIRGRSGIVAKLSGNYGRKKTTERKLGIFEIPSDSIINLHIGQNLKASSGASFPGIVNVLGFQSVVNVNISHEGLEFHAKGKMYELFDVSAIFKSGLMSWNDQQYVATGGFENEAIEDNLYFVLNKELTRYSTELLTKIQARLELSTQTEERAKSRLNEVQILRDEWLKKVKEINDEYEKVEDQLSFAEENLERLFDLIEDYSDEIRVLNQELNELCKVKECPKICQRGRSCTTCWEDVIAKKMGECSATCHQTKQERIPPLIMDAICKNEYCKRIHAVHSWLGDVLGLVVGVGGMLLGLPPQVSFGIGKSVSQFTRGIKKGDLDIGALLDGAAQALPVVGASESLTGVLKVASGIAKGNRNPLSIAGGLAGPLQLNKYVPDELKDLYQEVKNTKNKFKESLDEIISPIEDKVNTIISPVKAEVGKLTGKADEIISPIKDKVNTIILPVKSEVGKLTSKADEIRTSVEGKIDKALSTAKHKVDQITSSAKEQIDKKLSTVEEREEIFLPAKEQISSSVKKPTLPRILPRIKRNVFGLPHRIDSKVKNVIASGRNKVVDGISKVLKPRIKKVLSSHIVQQAKNVASKAVPVIGGVLSLVDKSQGHWECEIKEDKCTKGRFEYKYIHTPYTCKLPCEKRYVAKSIQKSCCSTVSCASFVADVRCISENTLCKKARMDALEQISKLKDNAATILGNLDTAIRNVSVWKMKSERLSVKVRAASSSLKAYQDAVGSLEKAYNVTVDNRKRKWKILAKPLMLRNLFNELGESLVKIENIKFKVKVSAEQNTFLLPINITMTLNGTQHEEMSTVLDFTNLNRSLRSIAKEILGVYVGDVSRISRKKRSTNDRNASTADDSKFYTLQTFHRLCSEFSNHKQTLYDVAMSLYNLSSEIHQLEEYEKRREESLIVNNSATFERLNFNQTKAMEFGVDVNYDSYSNVLENDPELLEAKAFQREVLKNEVKAVHSSSKLLYKNWLATMESIFETISEECSGFDDCLKYTIDSLSEINFDKGILNADKLPAQIDNIEVKFFNLTRKSDMSVNDAMEISWDILQILENMTGVEDVCAQAPNITEHPVPFTELGVNETLVLRCNATGDSLVYQWRFNGEILKNKSTNVLRINQTRLLHSGNYSCDVSNHVAKANSIVAVVVVGTRPLIVRHPGRRRNVILSGYDSLLCQVKKDEGNISYQWWFKPIKSSSFKALPNETFSRLSFAPVSIYHEGWYFCNVSNPFGHSSSKSSYVKVLKFSLPVPVAKLSLTVISKSRSSNITVFYQETLAKVLASRFSTTNNSSQPPEKRIKGLHPTGCRIITRHNDRSSRTEICDWTFSVVGENVTSNVVLRSSPSHQIKRIIRATFQLKSLIGQLGNETNGDGITFSLGKTNCSVEKNSLSIMAMSLFCPKGQFLVEDVYKCADCPPGSYGTLENGVPTCNFCPRDFYQSNPGQTSCTKCPEGFITAGQGAYDHKQCKDENKFFAVFVLVNNFHGDVLVTTNVSGQLEIDHLKQTKTMVKSKKWKTKKWLSVSAVDATTNRTIDINGRSVIHLEPTIKDLISLNVLYIQAPKLVDPNIKTTSTLTIPRTNTFTTPPDIHSTDGAPREYSAEKVVSTETVPGQPLTTKFAEDVKDSSNVTERNGQYDENKFFAMFLLVNNYHGDVLVTTNVSGELEIDHLKPTKKVVKSKQWKTKKWLSVSAVDATTNRTVDINGHLVIHLETTIKDLISLNVLYIQAPKLVDPNMKTASTLTTPQTSTFTTPPRKFLAEKVVSTETVPGRPLATEIAEVFKESFNVTERNGQHG